MAKYPFYVSYAAQGAKRFLEGSGSKRRAAAEQSAKSVGGKIESFYFAFGVGRGRRADAPPRIRARPLGVS